MKHVVCACRPLAPYVPKSLPKDFKLIDLQDQEAIGSMPRNILPLLVKNSIDLTLFKWILAWISTMCSSGGKGRISSLHYMILGGWYTIC